MSYDTILNAGIFVEACFVAIGVIGVAVYSWTHRKAKPKLH